MQMRNYRAPEGLDLGPASATSTERYAGSFITPTAPSRPRDEKGIFVAIASEDARVERRREQWRRAQERLRERRLAAKGQGQ